MLPLRLLLVEDALSFARALYALLRAASDVEVEMRHVETLAEARRALEAGRFDCVLLDMHLPDGEGLECVERIREVDPRTAIVVLTGLDDRQIAVEALRRGAQEYAVKGEQPPEELVRLIRHAIERNRVFNALNEQRTREIEAARHDTVTGLPNRQLLQERADGLLAETERLGLRAALLYIDLDGFKGVNDRYGHEIGDRVLREVARVLRQAVREPDIASRVGGDEFVILLLRVQDVNEAMAVADRVVRRVAGVTRIDERVISIGASAGVAMFREHGRNLAELTAAADAAMYEAKRAGKGTVRCSGEVAPRAAIPLAVAECDLVYQPWLRQLDGTVGGIEVYLAPAAGSRPPESLPRADSEALARSVLRTSALQWLAWRARGYAPPRLAVNLSAGELQVRGFAASRLEHLAELGFAPQQLQLDLAEHVLSMIDDSAIAELQRLRVAGVRIAVDRYGHGHAPLGSIARLGPDVLKFDAGLLHRLRAGERGALAVAAGGAAFARSLGIECCALGVETAADLTMCRDLGVDAVQGYWFVRPLASAECGDWLARRGLACVASA